MLPLPTFVSMTSLLLTLNVGQAMADVEWTLRRRQLVDDSLNGRHHGPDKDKVWLFAVDGYRKPDNYINEDGKLVGFDIDLVHYVCKEAGKKCKVVLTEGSECINIQRGGVYAGRGLMEGWVDGCPGYCSTLDRRSVWGFTRAYLDRPASWTVAPGNPRGFDPALPDLSNFTVAFQNGAFTNAACIARHGLKFKDIKIVNSRGESKALLLDGTLDAVLGSRYAVPGLDVLPARMRCDDDGTAVATKIGSSLSMWWDPALERLISSGRFYEWCKQKKEEYNGVFICKDKVPEREETSLHFYPEKRPGKKVWLFGFSGKRVPYAYQDQNGTLKGFNVDLVRAVCAEANEDCEFVFTQMDECSHTSGKNNVAGRGLMAGWIDACAGYADTQDRENTADYTTAFLSAGSHFAVLPGNPSGFRADAKDFSNFTLVHVSGAYTNPGCLHRLHRKCGKVRSAHSLHEAMTLMKDGLADALFAPHSVVPGLDVLTGVTLHCEQSGMGVKVKAGSRLVHWWDAAFRRLVRRGTYRRICQRASWDYDVEIPCLQDDEMLLNK